MISSVWVARPLYLLIRWVLWVLLAAVGTVDGVRHRTVRSRGWQLYALLVFVTWLFVLRETVLLAFAIELSTPTFGAYIFFSDLADSVWFFVLLSIAAGFW
jgi:hypothetical protein